MLRLIGLASLVAVPSLVALSTAACAQDEPVAQPFPVVGDEHDVTAVAGEWVGGYEGSRRSGVIAFQLTTRQGTARGHVVMIDATPVEGRMDPYAGPDLGTTFYGRAVDARLTGSTESVGTDADTVLQSRWWAQAKTEL